jgi:2-methylcitrate dehydratase PrpD
MGTDTLDDGVAVDVAVDVARVVAAARYEDIAPSDVLAAKKLILDVLGAGVAGSQEPGCTQVLELMREFGGAEQASVIGGGKLPLPAAVTVNSTMCRALELDDVSEQALIHTTASVVPGAIAAAEYLDEPVDGRRLLTAVAVGIDVANRLSLAPNHAMDGPNYRPRGMSYTYQIGTFATAAAIANLWGFDELTTLHAFGLAYSQAAGNQQCLLDGALAVRVQQGLSGAAGVLAALLAQRGVTGATSPLEGKFGYYRVYCADDYDRAAVLKELGERYTVGDVSIKPYPCCKFTHTAIAAALAARQDPRFDVAAVERVIVHVDNQEYFNVVCDPIEAKRRPTTSVEAQFSLPYTVAVALLTGTITLGDFEPSAIELPERTALAGLVEPDLGEPHFTTRMLPTPSRVEVVLRDGTVIEGRRDVAPGHPRDPLSWEQLEVKARQMVEWPARPLPRDNADRLIRACQELEDSADIRGLVGDHLSWDS